MKIISGWKQKLVILQNHDLKQNRLGRNLTIGLPSVILPLSFLTISTHNVKSLLEFLIRSLLVIHRSLENKDLEIFWALAYREPAWNSTVTLIAIESAGRRRTIYIDEMAIFIQSGRYLSLSLEFIADNRWESLANRTIWNLLYHLLSIEPFEYCIHLFHKMLFRSKTGS